MAFERGGPKKLIGEDAKAYFNMVARDLERDAQHIEAREREAAALQRDLDARTYYVAVRHLLGRNGDPVEVETERLPLVGRMRATGRDYDHAISNLWFGIAERLQKVGFVEDWDDARTAAVERFHFIPSMSDVMGVRV